MIYSHLLTDLLYLFILSSKVFMKPIFFKRNYNSIYYNKKMTGAMNAEREERIVTVPIAISKSPR